MLLQQRLAQPGQRVTSNPPAEKSRRQGKHMPFKFRLAKHQLLSPATMAACVISRKQEYSGLSKGKRFGHEGILPYSRLDNQTL